MNTRIVLFALGFGMLTIAVAPVFADPLPNEFAKFVQLPLNGGLPVYPVGAPYPGTLTPPSVLAGIAGAPVPFPGHDELSTAWVNPSGQPAPFVGQFQADDFADNYNTPVVHLQWWGSYMNQSTSGPVPAFDITFESDVPAVPAQGLLSHPGSPLLNQIVVPGAIAPASGTFTETAIPVAGGNPDGNLFLYNAELKLPFQEQADTVYWLKIVALDPAHTASDPGRIQWGWHDRDWGIKDLLAAGPPVPFPGEYDEAAAIGDPFGPVWHFQDDAVGGTVDITPTSLSPGADALVVQPTMIPGEKYVLPYDGPPGSVPLSKDLAFVLYTQVPEPSTIVLLGLGAMALAVSRRRRSA
jgi:hypothetical protein